MKRPVGAYGRHERLQHSPPQVGKVPPVVGPLHTWPAGEQPPTPEASARLQRPSEAPVAFVQRPPQQSVSAAHVSPFCAQYDGAEHTPLAQKFEQHSPFPPHGLPPVLQLPLSGVQVPLSHLPPQHSPSAVHAALSAVHCLLLHLPLKHENVQHWLFVVHAPLGAVHAVGDGTHTPVVGSHTPPLLPLLLPSPFGPPSVVDASVG